MNELITIATKALADFLTRTWKVESDDWWKKKVLDQLTEGQVRAVRERKAKTLHDLDLAALLRVFDRAWFDISVTHDLPRDGRGWVKELQGARNRWAHQSAQQLSLNDQYRDADTLGRLLGMIGAPASAVTAVEKVKATALVGLTDATHSQKSRDSDAGAPTKIATNGGARPKKPSKARKSLEIGAINKNGQVLVRATELPGTDHFQRIYVLKCRACGHSYGANGSDVWQRKCPECQGGRPGLDYNE